jgi:hypothetical protein
MRKAEPMRILVAFGALSQVGGEAFEDFRYEPLFDRARLAFACKGNCDGQEAMRGRSMPLFE